MTREEAIDLLDNLIGMVEDNHQSNYDTALQMAIQALEQEPSGDLISRQDAYKCLEIHGDYNTLNEVYERLEKLPSVNPQPCDDAISRDAEIKKLKEQPAKVYIDNTDYQRGYIAGVNQMVKELKVERDKAEQYPQEPKTGHWVAQNIHNCHTDFKCSECGYIHSFMHLYGKPTADYTYCPNCGARMVEPQERSENDRCNIQYSRCLL